jgi:serine/threonine-protein kinase
MAHAGSAGEKLGKYTLRGTLGRGAMGTVYDGWDPAIDRRVAIKTVRLADAEDEETAEALARFKREAQAAGRLSHPNIVGVYDYGETDDLAYIVMEFVEGRSLKSLLDQEKRLPPAEAGTIMQQVLAGLGYSHARGVVHRDIKPANIMLTSEGQVKIADFGIARIESSSMTSVGTVMGTPAYMPPEQFMGEPVDARSDIYAAGVMLFHLLTGVRPYEGSMTSIMQKVLSADPPPLASAAASLPAVFDGVIAGAMAKAPAQRYPNAGAFAQALRTALDVADQEPDADATLVAPSSRARSGSDATASMRRAALLAETTSTAPTAARAAAAEPSAKKRGPPVALFGGIAAAVLLAGGGAWFALQPGGAPKPALVVVPAKPVTPPPAEQAIQPPPQLPKPTAEQSLAKVQSAVSTMTCTDLSASLDGNGGIKVAGLAGSGQPEQDARAAAGQVAGIPVSWSATAVSTVYCGAVDLLRVARAPGDGPPAQIMPVTINGSPDIVNLTDKAPLIPRIALPDFPAWVLVEYLDNQAGISHMYPLRSAAAPRRASSVLLMTAKEIGAKDPNLVGPPFGTDMILAVASAKPLMPQPRPKNETPGEYINALKAAILDARSNGIGTAVGVILVHTAKR